jgi:hypothetical protein
MQRVLTLFLQAVVVLIGIGVFALMLWEPHLEGRNVHATTFQIYFSDPFLAYAYIASIPFFVALYQAFTLLGHIGRNQVFSPRSMRALRAIKYCALSLIGFLAGAEFYFVLVRRGQDDIAGGVAMGLFMIFVSAVAAATAAVFEATLQNTFDMKPGGDLAA